MFASNSSTGSSKLNELKAKIDQDAAFRGKFIKNLTTDMLHSMMKEHSISAADFITLRAYASQVNIKSNTNSYQIRVESGDNDKEGTYTVYDEPVGKRYVNGMWMRVDEDVEYRHLVLNTAARINALVVPGPVVTPVQSSASVPATYQHDVVPLMVVCETLNNNNITTSDAITKTLNKEIMEKTSNETLIDNFIKAAPQSFKPLPMERENLKAVTTVKTFELMPKMKNEIKEKVITTMARTPYPKNAPISEFNNAHVFGVPFPKSVYKYVGLAYDCDVPDDITDIHIHSSDIKYALAMSNKYKDKRVTYISSVPVGEDKAMIRGRRQEQMFAENEKAMGIFINYVVPPAKKDGDPFIDGRVIDKWDFEYTKHYSHWFRYCSIFAALPKMSYKPSFDTRTGKVCQSSHGEKFYLPYDELLSAMMAILVHRYIYVWYGLPLVCKVKCFKPLHGFEASLVMTKEAAKSLLGKAFLSFVNENDDLLSTFTEYYDKLFVNNLQVVKKKEKEKEKEEDEKIEKEEIPDGYDVFK